MVQSVCAWCTAMDVFCSMSGMNENMELLCWYWRSKGERECQCMYVWCVLATIGVDPELCMKDITMDSPVKYLCLSRRGPGSCLHALVELLSETHNSLVREAQKLSRQEDRCVCVCWLGENESFFFVQLKFYSVSALSRLLMSSCVLQWLQCSCRGAVWEPVGTVPPRKGVAAPGLSSLPLHTSEGSTNCQWLRPAGYWQTTSQTLFRWQATHPNS